MGNSHPETKPWIIAKILQSGARSVLDVGAGAGNWVDALRAHGYTGTIDAVEVWEPYVREFRLDRRYDQVFMEDIRTWVPPGAYDVVIFGDVLEHMSEHDAQALWGQWQGWAKHAAIAIPIVHYHQGALAGNPYEVHVKDDWTNKEVLATFPGITESQPFTVTGAYWR